MNTLEQLTVGEYVANDFRTAALFSKYGIDFCCKGNRTLEEVCIKKNINPTDLENEINSILETKNQVFIIFFGLSRKRAPFGGSFFWSILRKIL